MHKIFIVTIFLFLCSDFAAAQAVSSCLFPEAVDSNRKPVSEAKAETTVMYEKEIVQTDKQNAVRTEWIVPPEKSPFKPAFILSKSGCYVSQDFGGINRRYNRSVKVELLKIPATKEDAGAKE